MDKENNEFLSVLCELYMIALIAILPLYTKATYYQIGDAKYLFFKNISVLCLGVWVLYRLGSVIRGLPSYFKKILHHKQFCYKVQWSIVDCFMLFYGICGFVSAIASAYETTAWQGYRDWYMGAVSQVFFVGIYFLVSREYTGSAYPIYLGELALFGVVLIAFLQRFGVNLFQLQTGFRETDWAYSHMLTTIGNINWLCGYLSVLLPLPIVGYFYSARAWKQKMCYAISVLTLVLLLTQGSDIGIVLVAACLGLGFLYGIRQREFFEKSILLAIGVCVICPSMGLLMKLLGTWAMLPVDGFISAWVAQPIWWVMAVGLIIGYLLQRKLSNKVAKIVNRSLVITAFLVAGVVAVIYLCGLPEGAGWGSGRGGLWKAAWMAFCEMDIWHKLVGVGPDCFAEYIYTNPSIAKVIEMEGHWADSIFANAHNEWLNLLVNEGICGMTAYLGIFVCAFRRYRGMMVGVMVLLLYGINSLFSFQQVMNTPFLFLVLGICESKYREYHHKLAMPK